jgi:hypothetical protein
VRARAAVLAALVLAPISGLISGCGSSHTSGTNADPASVIPAASPLYASAIVRPSGSLQAAALADGRTLTHQADPYLHLLQALQTPGSTMLDFKRDVAPWLGPRAGAFLSSLGARGESSLGQLLLALGQSLVGGSSATSAFPFGPRAPAGEGGGGEGAIVLDTSNLARARSFVDSQAKRAGAHTAAYRNVGYLVTADGVAFGVIDRFVVIGSESGLRGVIDTTLGGPSLTRAPAYATLLAAAPSGALAHLYANPAAGLPGGSGSGSSSSARPGEEGPGLIGALAGARPANVSLVPATNSIALDADSLTGSASVAQGSSGKAGGLLSSVSEGAQTLAELPGESWLAVGLGDVGTTLRADVRALRSLASLGGSLAGPSGSESPAPGGLSLKGLLDGILTPLSELGANTAEARRDFQSWMGPAGIFASGSGLLELRAAVLITSKDAARSRAAVGHLGEQLRKAGATVTPASIPGTEASASAKLPGFPVVLYIAAGPDASGQSRFVIGLGEASVTDALNPPSRLAGSAVLAAASATLGEGIPPSLIVNVPTLLGLLEGIGLSANPPVSKLVPVLRGLTNVTGGGKSLSAAVRRFRVVLGLQQTR